MLSAATGQALDSAMSWRASLPAVTAQQWQLRTCRLLQKLLSCVARQQQHQRQSLSHHIRDSQQVLLQKLDQQQQGQSPIFGKQVTQTAVKQVSKQVALAASSKFLEQQQIWWSQHVRLMRSAVVSGLPKKYPQVGLSHLFLSYVRECNTFCPCSRRTLVNSLKRRCGTQGVSSRVSEDCKLSTSYQTGLSEWRKGSDIAALQITKITSGFKSRSLHLQKTTGAPKQRSSGNRSRGGTYPNSTCANNSSSNTRNVCRCRDCYSYHCCGGVLPTQNTNTSSVEAFTRGMCCYNNNILLSGTSSDNVRTGKGIHTVSTPRNTPVRDFNSVPLRLLTTENRVYRLVTDSVKTVFFSAALTTAIPGFTALYSRRPRQNMCCAPGGSGRQVPAAREAASEKAVMTPSADVFYGSISAAAMNASYAIHTYSSSPSAAAAASASVLPSQFLLATASSQTSTHNVTTACTKKAARWISSTASREGEASGKKASAKETQATKVAGAAGEGQAAEAEESDTENEERETIEVDVLIVGGGIAGLSAAIRLKQLELEYHQYLLKQHQKRSLSEASLHPTVFLPTPLRVCVIDKGASIGSHVISGNVFDPVALDELFPEWRQIKQRQQAAKRSKETAADASKTTTPHKGLLFGRSFAAEALSFLPFAKASKPRLHSAMKNASHLSSTASIFASPSPTTKSITSVDAASLNPPLSSVAKESGSRSSVISTDNSATTCARGSTESAAAAAATSKAFAATTPASSAGPLSTSSTAKSAPAIATSRISRAPYLHLDYFLWRLGISSSADRHGAAFLIDTLSSSFPSLPSAASAATESAGRDPATLLRAAAAAVGGGPPVDTIVTDEELLYLLHHQPEKKNYFVPHKALDLPLSLLPSRYKNIDRSYVVNLGDLCAWLARVAEEMYSVEIYPGFAAAELLAKRIDEVESLPPIPLSKVFPADAVFPGASPAVGLRSPKPLRRERQRQQILLQQRLRDLQMYVWQEEQHRRQRKQQQQPQKQHRQQQQNEKKEEAWHHMDGTDNFENLYKETETCWEEVQDSWQETRGHPWYICGVQLSASGLTQDGRKTDHYTPGANIIAKQVLLAEGCCGSLSEQAIAFFGLRHTPREFVGGVEATTAIGSLAAVTAAAVTALTGATVNVAAFSAAVAGIAVAAGAAATAAAAAAAIGDVAASRARYIAASNPAAVAAAVPGRGADPQVFVPPARKEEQEQRRKEKLQRVIEAQQQQHLSFFSGRHISSSLIAGLERNRYICIGWKKTAQKFRCPQLYGLGMKEIWEIEPEKHKPGKITHTIGWPLRSTEYGGGFIYHIGSSSSSDTTINEDDSNSSSNSSSKGDSNKRGGKSCKVLVGFTVGLDYTNPYLRPYEEFQLWKTHPSVAAVLRGGRCISYGARCMNEGGWQAVPRLFFPGGLLLGASAGLLDIVRLKGSNTAMKSGIVAAEALAAKLFLPFPDDSELDREVVAAVAAVYSSYRWRRFKKKAKEVYSGKPPPPQPQPLFHQRRRGTAVSRRLQELAASEVTEDTSAFNHSVFLVERHHQEQARKERQQQQQHKYLMQQMQMQMQMQQPHQTQENTQQVQQQPRYQQLHHPEKEEEKDEDEDEEEKKKEKKGEGNQHRDEQQQQHEQQQQKQQQQQEQKQKQQARKQIKQYEHIEWPVPYGVEVSAYEDRLRSSWVLKDLYRCRNVRPTFRRGLFWGLLASYCFTFLSRGREPFTFLWVRRDAQRTSRAVAEDPIHYPPHDGVLTVYEYVDAPEAETLEEPSAALKHAYYITDQKKARLIDHPLFAEEKKGKKQKQMKLQINCQNCIHCKCCAIKAFKDTIVWTVPQGGDGPRYSHM